MRHPQFRSSDLRLNIHRLEFVQRGEWVFTLPLPGARAIEAPYPPLFYAVMLPLANFVRDKALLVEATAAVALAAGALLTFALARRVTGDDGAALWAAGCYGLLPITYAMASAGNFANLFGQGVANIALVALILAWGRWDRPSRRRRADARPHARAPRPLRRLPIAAGDRAAAGHRRRLPSARMDDDRRSPSRPASRRRSSSPGRSTTASTPISCSATRATSSAARPTRAARDDGPAFAQRLRNLWGGLLLWWGWPALPLALAGINLLRRLRPSPHLWLALAWLGTRDPLRPRRTGRGPERPLPPLRRPRAGTRRGLGALATLAQPPPLRPDRQPPHRQLLALASPLPLGRPRPPRLPLTEVGETAETRRTTQKGDNFRFHLGRRSVSGLKSPLAGVSRRPSYPCLARQASAAWQAS